MLADRPVALVGDELVEALHRWPLLRVGADVQQLRRQALRERLEPERRGDPQLVQELLVHLVRLADHQGPEPVALVAD